MVAYVALWRMKAALHMRRGFFVRSTSDNYPACGGGGLMVPRHG